MRRLTTALATVLVAALTAPLLPATPVVASTELELEGAGWGHGRGMGQWGALGYATDHGWTFSQILDHYYGNTAKGTISANATMTVRLLKFDGTHTLATSSGGAVTVTGLGGSHAAVRVRYDAGAGVFRVDTASSCGGPWSHQANVGGGQVVEIKAASGLVQVCEPGGRRSYRGFLRATRDGSSQRTVNVVALEDYLRGVVPRESPASWGDRDGGKGMHALRAQAVAARSYAWSENRYPYAKTCDTTACQVYGGQAFNGTVLEHPNTDQAIADTKGEIRVFSNGNPARTEYSSSTGGWTAGGTFPAVRDDGDNVAGNPNHRWTDRVSASAIETALPEIGRFRTIDVTERNGHGAWGGRVLEVVVRGSQGSATLTGGQFRSRFGLKSDWFRHLRAPSGGVVGTWVLDSAGGVFTFGSARFHGSVPQLRQQGVQIGQARIISLAATPTGNGYWVLDDAGGMFAFGDARFFGSVPGLRQAGIPVGPADIVAMTPTATGRGYWVLDEHGGVFAFGDARFHGSIPALREAGRQIGRASVVAIAGTPDGDGYWMLDDRGGVFAFGRAHFAGSLPGAGISARAVDIVPTKTGRGYLIAVHEGARVHPFGDAPDFGWVSELGVQTTGRGIAVRYES